ncbi:Eukaryotic aspartyl protease family protein putative isoform 4 [Tripterygium wilfordii]|uniref:Eukaryotic aspartyl protease family protein putative isoform 4 n=1 Tax=Tripterygium wilfordii TaxID=458696 RepID=A0A7J7DAJ2_TRIWF|nr:aspartyl protease family protein At5g10770-like [Tripterygium wilfordii]KAF5743377.1 Eukaryotic aspartyl protease family protein putative isoform 4 [Tripterygium wilfordii]
MASLSRLSFFFHALFVCLCFLVSLEKTTSVSASASIDGRKVAAAESTNHHHTIKVSSIFPSSGCNPSTTKVSKEGSTLKVVHKHGPCSKLHKDKENTPNHSEILKQDQARVDKIRSRIAKNSGLNQLEQTKAANLPAKSGSSLGSGNYLVTVGLGTPAKELSLIFDTGSDLTWTQCEPCVKSCYQQQDPTFDPSQSTTYSNVSCSSTTCSSLSSATGNSPGCSSSTCVYGIQYGDSSFSVGFFGKERLTLTSTDVFNDFYFGCGQNNQGLFGSTAGLLGLGRDKLSLVSQTAQKYNKIFSYCLPSSSSSTGHLTFGGSPSSSAKYTPISTVGSFYGIDFTAISVGGRKLSISSSVFSTAGAIIDSGTVITRLPPAAYSALRTAFRQMMSKYPMAEALSILDTCYDLSKYTTISVPKISLSFNGGAQVDIDARGTLYASSTSQVCLAFAGNTDDTDIAIFGNTQQKTIEVVYDGAGGRVGFAPGVCK